MSRPRGAFVIVTGAASLVVLACDGGQSRRSTDSGGFDARVSDAAVADAPGDVGAATPDVSDAASDGSGPMPPPDATPSDSSASDSGPGPLRVTSALITDEHRFVPGAMFGGWGPHLGHLVRVEGGVGSEADLYWVDDLCVQGSGDCDVNVNRRVGIFRRDEDEWISIGRIPLPVGVQQNTGTIATDEQLLVYGVDTSAQTVVECTFDVPTGTSRGCSGIGLSAGASANYVGAALSPTGSKVVWWTNVADGTGGTFSYVVEYTAGWNGPRSAVLPGYNDCAYINASFGAAGSPLTLFGQTVTGRAPSWVFSTLVGRTDALLSVPVVWANALAPPAGDPVASTNDLWIDPSSGDAHLIARTTSGAAAYYHRPSGGSFGAARVIHPSALRARWLVTEDALHVVYGPNDGGLRLLSFSRRDLVAGVALDVDAAAPEEIAVPADLGPVVGIYPEAAIYQAAAVGALAFVVVGTTRQNEAVFFEIAR